ncbi:homeodomain-like superfamily protein, partial [Striga asiatica]
MSDNSKKANPNEGSHHFVPKSVNEIMRKVLNISDFSEKLSKLDLHIRSYENELRKVEHLQRELPLCMELLQDVIAILIEEKFRCEEEKSNSMKDLMENTKNWISMTQLWTTPVEYEADIEPMITKSSRQKEVSTSSEFNCGKGAFTSFKKPSQLHIHEEGQMEKKPRRVWESELHDSFVDALKRLGGPY